MRLSGRGFLVGVGLFTVLYAVTVLEFVAISPDLRMRAYLLDQPNGVQDGVVVRVTPGLRWKEGQQPPVIGDEIRYVNRMPTPTLLDFFNVVDRLYDPDDDMIDRVNRTDDPREWSRENFSGLLDELDDRGNRRRLVEVLYRSRDRERLETCWVEVQSVPASEIVITLIWLVPHLGILLVGGAAIWQRPFDRVARLFYVMSLVTLGAYVGGFHWWTVANSAWLAFPFLFCGGLLPAITLHFFLVFPRPSGWVARRPGIVWFLYVLPLAGIIAGGGFFAYAAFVEPASSVTDPTAIREKLAVLAGVRTAVDLYIATAAVYYGLTLAALVRSMLTVRDPSERAQVLWILTAALLATVPVGYTVWLAATDRSTFAFGGARLPMFFASFGFLLAYAAAMVRHRLFLADELIGKGVRYYAARLGLAVLVALALTALGLWAGAWDSWLPHPQSAAALVAVIVLAVVLVLAVRDRLQQELDRHFFSEKYQLGAALRGVHAAADHQADEAQLGRRVLDSCREALEVSRAALYRRTETGPGIYRLAAALGEGFPDELAFDAIMAAPTAGGSVQRVLTGSRTDISPVQTLLRRLSAQLLYAPPAGGNAATLLILGPKALDAAFSAEDLTFLGALGHVADVALDGVGVQRLHGRLTEKLQLLAEQLRLAEETSAGQSRQIAVLQAELADLHRRQGTATPAAAADAEFRRDIIRGDSPAILQVLETVRKVAGSDATVMIRGESGTGKELLAQVIHDNSPRRDGPMIRVHCAALSPTLLESELFGHAKGAFTGADREKIGRFQLADGGTLFLDEIGEISPEIQVKLLRVLQERCFEPVGSSKTVTVDVRLVTATNRNLEEMIAGGEFRDDLYYRLNVISVTLPPLRERKGDVYDLAFTFMHRTARRLGKVVTGIDDEALSILARHPWPGNVRELQNVIERAVVLADGEAITLDDLPAELGPLRSASRSPKGLPAPAASEKQGGRRRTHLPRPTAVGRRAAVSAADGSEREQLVAALLETAGNKAEAARLLGLPRSTFFSKLKKYDLG